MREPGIDYALQERILILTPTGQDGPLASQFLESQDVGTEVMQTMPALLARLDQLAGAIMIAEEAFTSENVLELKDKIAEQEKWSDIPVILLTSQKEFLFRTNQILSFFVDGGNISLLERPFSKTALITAVQVALRARRKQYEVRDLLVDQIKAVRLRDDFLSLASHELKTPLTSIKLHVQLRQHFLKKGDLSVYSPTKVNALINTTASQVDRLTRLIDDMLDVSRIQSGKLTLNQEWCDLGEVVQQVHDALSSQFEAAGIPITINIRAKCEGFWDRFRIEQVITNLFTNALKYGNRKPVTVLVHRVGSNAILSVHDQGLGIAPKDQDRIFQRFERASNDNNISGLGLGLFITRQILELHRGRIWLESELGRGTSFFIELPMKEKTTSISSPDANYAQH